MLFTDGSSYYLKAASISEAIQRFMLIDEFDSSLFLSITLIHDL